MLSHLQKLVLVLGTTLILLAVTIYGVYHLGMAYISSEIDGLLDGLNMSQHPGVERNSHQVHSTPNEGGSTTQPSTQNQPGSESSPMDKHSASAGGVPELTFQPSKGTLSGSITNRPLQLVGALEMVNGDNMAKTLSSLGLTTAERQHAQSLLPIISRMSLQEKLFAVRCISKFSISELVQMFRWYRQGDSTAIERIKQRFYERFSAEDIQRILQIADKYR